MGTYYILLDTFISNSQSYRLCSDYGHQKGSIITIIDTDNRLVS